MSDKCKNCNKFLRKFAGYKKVIKTEEEAKLFSECLKKTIIVNDILCNKCRLLIYYRKKNALSSKLSEEHQTTSEEERPKICDEVEMTTEGPNEASDINSEDFNTSEDFNASEDSYRNSDSDFKYDDYEKDDYIEMPFKRVVSTHKYCIICRKTTDIKVISLEIRLKVFAKKKIFIPNGDRCCKTHLIGNHFYEDDLSQMRIVSYTSKVEKAEFTLFFNTLGNSSQSSSIFERMNEFDMSDDQLNTLTGLSWENIINLRQLLTSMNNTSTHSVTQALIIFLFKLKTGNSNKLIASIFGLSCEQQVSDCCTQIMTSFEIDILTYHFGYNTVSRQDLINNTCDTVRKILNANENQLILIADGTYIQYQKSNNNYYQRKSNSGQKKANLSIPFTLCTTNGFVLDFAGPFYGALNDDSIMKIVLKDILSLESLLLPNDILIVDRGFCDVVEFLKQKGLNVFMPALKGNKPQLSTEEANVSRMITKIRWVVEALHGNIAQKYKLSHDSVDSKMIELLCKIVGFLHNKYGKKLDSDGTLNEVIVQYMKSRMEAENTLSREAFNHHWNRKKTNLKHLTALEVLDFPHLSEDQLKILFTGSYQFSQALAYCAELLGNQNNLSIRYVKSAPNILKAEVKSRHIRNKVYCIYIHYISNSTVYNSIQRYCCNCPNGNRTMGCCSHVAAVIYYLSYGRYLSRTLCPAEIITKIFETQDIPIVINYDSDDD